MKAWAVFFAESKHRPRAVNEVASTDPRVNGTQDRGVCQLNTYWQYTRRLEVGHPFIHPDDMFDPIKSLQYSLGISNGGRDFTAWNVTRVGPDGVAPFQRYLQAAALCVYAASTR